MVDILDHPAPRSFNQLYLFGVAPGSRNTDRIHYHLSGRGFEYEVGLAGI